MSNSIQEKFNVMDVIFEKDRSFIVNKVKETWTYKEYDLLTMKNNEKELDLLLEEINELSRNNDNTSGLMKNPYYNELTSKADNLSKEQICFGKIKVEMNLVTKEIEVLVETTKENKIFIYDEQRYMDDFIGYMDEINRIAQNVWDENN
ncbi:TPA: hypothetical protein QCR36_000912 [Bacillus cereus]|nr:hypothetical protein [Bacillus cereus]HDR4740910.1 hypothetical protein [Bacillus cereus]HDR4745316.1 hypothetical protein [Bacillus cereus]HDR4750822.1 hypothetical protein [Bacillus cereus]HDR4767801.1 hypothetical protein [Bacillus cereus]